MIILAVATILVKLVVAAGAINFVRLNNPIKMKITYSKETMEKIIHFWAIVLYVSYMYTCR